MSEGKQITVKDDLRGTIAKMEPQFKMALPSHISTEKFVRVVQTAVNNNADLIKANRPSLLAAAMRAAQDGLLPDGKEAAFVLFGDKATYMPMVRGILKQMRNSGEIASISPNVVFEHDFFDYWIDENGEHLKHKPKLAGERGEITHAYAIGRTKDGATYIVVMSKDELEQVRKVSRSKDGGPWKSWYGEMAKKTCLRRLSKIMPTSTDLENVLHADDELFNPPPDTPADPPTPPEKKVKSSRLAKLVGATAPKPDVQTDIPADVSQDDERDPQNELDSSEIPI